MAGRIQALEKSLAEVREESRKAVESVRQAVAGKAALADLEVNFGAPTLFLFKCSAEVKYHYGNYCERGGGGGKGGRRCFRRPPLVEAVCATFTQHSNRHIAMYTQQVLCSAHG